MKTKCSCPLALNMCGHDVHACYVWFSHTQTNMRAYSHTHTHTWQHRVKLFFLLHNVTLNPGSRAKYRAIDKKDQRRGDVHPLGRMIQKTFSFPSLALSLFPYLSFPLRPLQITSVVVYLSFSSRGWPCVCVCVCVCMCGCVCDCVSVPFCGHAARC